MKNNLIRYSMIVLLVGLVALCADWANAQPAPTNEKFIEILSYSFGSAQGTSTRIKIYLSPSSPERQVDPVSARIQLLDTEGEVMAQSDEIKVSPGKIRFWDVPRNLLPASGEPGQRLEMVARIVVKSLTDNLDPAFILPSIEVIDDFTGKSIHVAGKTFLIFATGPIRPVR